MKELSIEEKVKRYDEAIEKGKQILNTPYTAHWDTMKEVVEHLLPELAESKDEKVKKSLIRLVKAFYDVNFPTPEGFTKEQLISWLEEQDEQKTAEWSKKDEDISSAIIKRLSGSDALSVDLQSAICWIENVKDRVQH